MNSTRFHFVAVAVDGNRSDDTSRRAVRAHAARNINVRRERVARYQSQRQADRASALVPHRQSLQPVWTGDGSPGTEVWTSVMQTIAQKCTTPDPPSILGIDTPDPFDSFHRALTSPEKLFLDYCRT